MNEQQALIAAIRATPEEDTPRLAYADWLDEHASNEAQHARAEFIRLQVGRSDWSRELYDKAEALLNTHKEAWLQDDFGGAFPAELVRAVRFFRGFPDTVSLTQKQWEDHAEILLSHAPVTTLYVTEVTDIGRLAKSPLLARLSKLAILNQFHHVGDDGARALAMSPYLSNLETLDIRWAHLTDAGTLALAMSPYMSKLTRLDLGNNRDISDDGIEALRHTRWLGRQQEPENDDVTTEHNIFTRSSADAEKMTQHYHEELKRRQKEEDAANRRINRSGGGNLPPM